MGVQEKALEQDHTQIGKLPSYMVSQLMINHQIYTLEQMQIPESHSLAKLNSNPALTATMDTGVVDNQRVNEPARNSLSTLSTTSTLSSSTLSSPSILAEASKENAVDKVATKNESGHNLESCKNCENGENIENGEDLTKSWLQRHFAKVYGPESFAVQVANFLAEWFSSSPEITVQTSGSTGTPKQMKVSKERMCNSARLTVEFLGLQAKEQAHLCMPMQYIAGKMVVVRALMAGLDLIVVEPSGRPLQLLARESLEYPHLPLKSPEFSAMIPMQVFNTLNALHTVENTVYASLEEKEQALKLASREIELLKGIKQLIIGGGSIDEGLAIQLKSFPHGVWSTYGMTETLSHIALRRLSGEQASEWYTPFAHVHLSASSEQTLVIDAPLVAAEILSTNDIVEFNEQGQFKILGRRDNTINTGGVKVQIEQVEAALKALSNSNSDTEAQVKSQVKSDSSNQGNTQVAEQGKTQENLALGLDWPFMVSYAADAKFGQIVVLLVECPALSQDELKKVLRSLETLPPYWQPKLKLRVNKLPQTGSGKPDRASAVRMISEFLAKLEKQQADQPQKHEQPCINTEQDATEGKPCVLGVL